MRKVKLLVLCSIIDKHLGFLKDIEERSDIKICYISEKQFKFPLNIIKRIFIGGKVNRFINMPFKHKWYDYESPNVEFEQVLVVANGYLCGWMPLLKECKRKHIPITAFILDAIDTSSPTLTISKSIIFSGFFDNIYSFDQKDCLKYGFKHSGYCYYSKIPVLVQETKNDLYFIGGLKGGRQNLLEAVYDYLKSTSVIFYFDLFGKSNLNGDSIHHLVSWISYSDVVRKVNESNCILEVVQGGQHGPTLRYFEAVVYNKKLLTNNPEIVNFPYYNPSFMKVFSSKQDIDVDWIKERSNIDYHYKGDFSPNNLIDKILVYKQ